MSLRRLLLPLVQSSRSEARLLCEMQHLQHISSTEAASSPHRSQYLAAALLDPSVTTSSRQHTPARAHWPALTLSECAAVYCAASVPPKKTNTCRQIASGTRVHGLFCVLCSSSSGTYWAWLAASSLPMQQAQTLTQMPSSGASLQIL